MSQLDYITHVIYTKCQTFQKSYMSLEQKECKKITSSNEKGIDKFKVDALFAFFIDKKEKKRDGPGREKEGRSWKKKKRDGPGKKKRGPAIQKTKKHFHT